MRVLAIDTALAACSAAVLDTGNIGIVASESLLMARGHAEALMPLVERVVKKSGVAFAEFERVVVTTGPGSSPVCASAFRRRAALASPLIFRWSA